MGAGGGTEVGLCSRGHGLVGAQGRGRQGAGGGALGGRRWGQLGVKGRGCGLVQGTRFGVSWESLVGARVKPGWGCGGRRQGGSNSLEWGHGAGVGYIGGWRVWERACAEGNGMGVGGQGSSQPHCVSWAPQNSHPHPKIFQDVLDGAKEVRSGGGGHSEMWGDSIRGVSGVPWGGRWIPQGPMGFGSSQAGGSMQVWSFLKWSRGLCGVPLGIGRT